MDNRVINVITEDFEDIEHILKVVWKNAPGGKATHYKIVKFKEVVHYLGDPVTSHYTELEKSESGVNSLILYWSADRGAQPLPFSLDRTGAADFIKNWLREIPYPPKPDIDGSSSKGFRIFTDRLWGFAGNSHYGIIVVQPHWAMHGK